MHYQTVVGDNSDRIKAFDIGFSRAEIVICTGGLGPTQDDITKEALAEYFGVEMVYDEGSYEHVKNIYMRFRRDFPQNNMRQTYFPEGSIILDNPNGTANGCIYRGKDSQGNYKIGILLRDLQRNGTYDGFKDNALSETVFQLGCLRRKIACYEYR